MMQGFALLPPFAAALFYGERNVAKALGITAAVAMVFGIAGQVVTRNHKIRIKVRESYFVVFLCWMTAITVSIFPYLLSGQHYSVADCIFEAVASWTTSSAWVIDINSMPKALVLWKAMSNWLGGMGVIQLAVIVLSALGAEGQKMANAEVPGPQLEKVKPKMMDTAKVLYSSYGLLSLLELVFLMAGRMPFFDALVNTMSSISTAGIMDYNNCVDNYFTPYIKVVIVIFSIVAAMNFILFMKLREGKIREVFRDYELRMFLSLIGVTSVFMAIVLMSYGVYDSFGSAVINAAAGTVSFGSTSGITIEGLSQWPSVCKMVLFVMMIVGGCSNSTSGGIKVIRAAIFAKLIRRGFYKRIHPQSIRPIMIKKKPVSAQNASSISTFILLFTAIYIFSCIVISLENMDMETTLTAPMALFTNTGVGFGRVTDAYYGWLSEFNKIYASLLMLAGRLEMYAILIIFSRSFWNSDRIK